MRRLLPDPVEAITALDAYDIERTPLADRPWLGVCMIAGIDGSTVVERGSRALGSPADTQVLLSLRRLADLLIVGAGTVRIERYDPPSSGVRVGVVSRTGDLDMSLPLFTSGQGFLIVPESAPERPGETIRAGTTDVDLAAALREVRTRFGSRFVQCEGGAALNGALAEADLIDELNLTVSPHITGGDGPRVTSGAAESLRRMDLAHVLEDDGFLFTRYVRRR